MAVRSWLKSDDAGKTHRYTWVNLANGDTGQPISVPGAADMTVQVHGTWGTGGTLIIQGSLEATPSNWFTARDGGDNLISFTSADGEMLVNLLAHIRPKVTAGDGDTDFTVILFVRSTVT